MRGCSLLFFAIFASGQLHADKCKHALIKRNMALLARSFEQREEHSTDTRPAAIYHVPSRTYVDRLHLALYHFLRFTSAIRVSLTADRTMLISYDRHGNSWYFPLVKKSGNAEMFAYLDAPMSGENAPSIVKGKSRSHILLAQDPARGSGLDYVRIKQSEAGLEVLTPSKQVSPIGLIIDHEAGVALGADPNIAGQLAIFRLDPTNTRGYNVESTGIEYTSFLPLIQENIFYDPRSESLLIKKKGEDHEIAYALYQKNLSWGAMEFSLSPAAQDLVVMPDVHRIIYQNELGYYVQENIANSIDHRIEHEFSDSAEIAGIQAAQSKQEVHILNADGTLKTWNVLEKKRSFFREPENAQSASVSVNKQGTRLLESSGSQLILVDLVGKTELWRSTVEDIHEAYFSSDSNMILAITESGNALLIETDTGLPLVTLEDFAAKALKELWENDNLSNTKGFPLINAVVK
jgi:hypothetical protein